MDFTGAFAAFYTKLILGLFLAGGVVFLGGYLLIGWLVENISISWS